ncbi:MAG: hypothetical protein NT007_17685 [Candidatus Kapabacteria bacterium]|nr:hypothetical protein [Candidatus Kapabacteria bacterium]
MKTKSILRLIILFFLFIFIQSHSSKAAEEPKQNQIKFEQLKKMKLLEYLNLSEVRSEQFLMKYSLLTKKIKEKNEEIDLAAKNLNQAVKSHKGYEIKIRTEELMRKQREMMDMLKDMQQEMQSVLSEEEFAKYLLFERNFNREMRKFVQKNLKK